jgi:predicted DNA-binding transcriptional regulator AlpA
MSEKAVRTITLANVAKREGVSKQTIHRWIEKGLYPKPVIGKDGTGRNIRFSKADIEK